MKSLMIILLTIVFAASAQAGGPKGGGNTVAGAHAGAKAKASAHAVAGAAAVSNATSGGNSLSVGGDEAAASSAIAPGLVANGCMGSTSLGGQGMSFGVSLGTTWKDPDCIRIRKAQDLQKAGFGDAAMAIRCNDDETRAAMRLTGTPCPQDKAAAAITGPRPLASAAPPDPDPKDRGCLVNRDLAIAMGQTC